MVRYLGEDVAGEEAVRYLLAREERVAGERGPHEHTEVEQRAHGGLETDGESEAGEERAEVAVEVSGREAAVLAQHRLQHQQRPAQDAEHHRVHQQEGHPAVLQHNTHPDISQYLTH